MSLSMTSLCIMSAGDFSYTEGSSGWTDSSIGSQGWVLHKNSTSKGTITHWYCIICSLFSFLIYSDYKNVFTFFLLILLRGLFVRE